MRKILEIIVTCIPARKTDSNTPWKLASLPDFRGSVFLFVIGTKVLLRDISQFLVFSLSKIITKYLYSGKAVDGNRDGNLHDGSCARTTKFENPWWRVDLGNKVWVEKVLIANRDDCCSQELSNVEIRIGKTEDDCMSRSLSLNRTGRSWQFGHYMDRSQSS